MATSLEKFVNNLSKDAFNNVRRYYAADKLDLLTRKGVYPHEYMDSSEKLKETQLPPKEAFNSKLKDESITDEKDFFKLMNNSVFGKTMEIIRNRVDVELVNDKEQAEKSTAKPNFNQCNIFCEDLVAIHMKKMRLVFDKPVYLGMCILDLSKTLMYDFHYNHMKQKYGDKAKLLFTDTDSFVYEIETSDFYENISADVKGKFDTSNYPSDYSSGIPTGFNKEVLGMFKDEAGGEIIDEFVGLKKQSYILTKCSTVKKIRNVRE